MFANGNIAVALVKKQVTIVQVTQTQSKREKYLHVKTYTPFGEGLFLASDFPSARITPSDILAILPPLKDDHLLSDGLLELPKHSFTQYLELNSRNNKRYEDLWIAYLNKF